MLRKNSNDKWIYAEGTHTPVKTEEMPIHKVNIEAELDLPIDIEEWIYSRERTRNNEWLKEKGIQQLGCLFYCIKTLLINK